MSPSAFGVPLSTPPAERVRPAGSVPLLRVNVALPTALVCVNVWLECRAPTPVVVAGFVTAIWLHTVMVNVCGVEPATFAAVM